MSEISTRQADLRLAHDRASQAYEAAKKLSQSGPEEQLFLDLAQTTVEALDCYKSNTTLQVGCILRIARYAYYDAETPMLKLGYALTMLLNELLTERLTYAPNGSSTDQAIPVPSDPSGRLGSITPAIDEVNAPINNTMELFMDPVDEETGETKPSTSSSNVNLATLLNNVMPKEEFGDDQTPFDEAFEDTEPLADIFCPTTGESRPFDPSFLNFGMEVETTDDVLDQTFDQSDGPSTSAAPDFSSLFRRSKTPPKRSHKKKATPKTAAQPKVKVACHLCGKKPGLFERTPPPALAKARSMFLDRILLTSQAVEDRVHVLRFSPDLACFCTEHIALPLAARNLNVRAKNVDMSLFERLVKKSSCDLCDDPRYPLRVTPTNPTDARRMLGNNLKDMSKEQTKKIESFLKGWKQATICQRHF